MKRIVALVLALIMTVCLCACGKEAPDTEPNETKKDSNAVKADEGLLTIKITVPASFLDEKDTPESLKKEAEKRGFKSCTINDDGSVTYEMTKSQRNDLLKEIKADMDTNLQEIIDDPECSIEKIDYNKDLTEFTAYTNDKYTAYDNLASIVFYMYGSLYQIYNGVDLDDIDVKVKFINSETKEVVFERSHKEFLNSAAAATEDTSDKQ